MRYVRANVTRSRRDGVRKKSRHTPSPGHGVQGYRSSHKHPRGWGRAQRQRGRHKLHRNPLPTAEGTFR